MNTIFHLVVVVSHMFVPFGSVSAQVSDGHQFLARLVGHWDAQIENWGWPEAKSPTKFSGEEIITMLGEYWLQSELTIDSFDKGVFSHWSLGYSPVEKKYNGIKICAISPYCENQSGSIDSTGNVLTLLTIDREVIEGKDIVEGKLIIEIIDVDHWKSTFFRKINDSGEYWKSTEIKYVRKNEAEQFCTQRQQDVNFPKEMTNSIGMKLVLIPKGTFTMGEPPSQEGLLEELKDNERQHEVTISKDYFLGIHEVTQAQYEKVMGRNPSQFQGDKVAERLPITGSVGKEMNSSNYPVDSVSWEDAVEFCKRLSALPEEKKAGRLYRLPTEAEWEYACRASSKTRYSYGDDAKSLGDYAWFLQGPAVGPQSVGQKKPNAWGLYDMHGNIWEWCSDWWDIYPEGAATDPVGPGKGSQRVVRGGGWESNAVYCRSAMRFAVDPSYSDVCYGFRVVTGP